jgi:hypothetical protein
MPWIIVSPCYFFGNTGGGIVLAVSSESESTISSAVAADVPAAVVVVAAIAAAAIAAAAIATAASVATGFTLFSCGRAGVPGAFRFPGITPGASVVDLSTLIGVILVTNAGSNDGAAWETAALQAANLSLRYLPSNAARTCTGIRKSISSIDVGERDVIVMIGVYWYSRVLLSSF